MSEKVKNRGWVKNVAIIFLAVMLVLTFFSNTIMNRSLPEVTGQSVQPGSITTQVRGDGTIEAAETYEVKSSDSRKVQSVPVSVGQEVKVGDTLVVLAAGDSQELEEAQDALEAAQLAYQQALIEAGKTTSGDREIERAREKLQQAITDMLRQENVVAVVSGSGTFNVPSSRGVQYKVGDPEPLPEVVLPIEDHGRMVRMLTKGEPVKMALEIKNVFTDNQKINNVIAEIPGTDPKLKDEVVLIGAHLDSWHGGTGGADNASGCIVMMEAMRIIKALGVSPRRTIRIALWGGEEQGLYGSRGYAKRYLYDAEKNKKLSGFEDFALYLNMDNGSGRFRGIYLEENDAAVPFFKEWGKALESLGFTTLTLRKTSGTDHLSFIRYGLPAFQFIQDELEYDRTYHTVMDTYERLSLSDLTVDAAMVAWLALNAAMDDKTVPVKPGYPVVEAAR